MRLLSHSHAAHENRENQDHIESRRVGNRRLVALADGQGGRAGGALASRIAVQSALDWLEKVPGDFDTHTLQTAISVADEAVEAQNEAGYSTLILLVCEQNQIVGASVGDSLALHITPTTQSELTGHQRKNPPIGSSAALGTPFSAQPQAGEQILLMSDGVFRFASLEAIARTCRASEDLDVLLNLLNLQKRSETGALPDDWSAILLRF
ncbi:hypothetical protein IAD21_01734 [Abditibacteriota bacterium]|nr:hypothetical protein IAD21_01734 [Abditibacteriota bacterium]